ncbi:MAG: ribonucleotide-diphosphate reductase subunit beta [Sulfitobacter sp.]|nr:ribonucleotide-diphosphate reductase subunit beta [Sulfitobacter sp.]
MEDPERFTLLPLKYPDVFEFYRMLEFLLWHSNEVALTQDKKDLDEKLSPGEREYYGYGFGMFGHADEKVMQNLDTRFLDEVKMMELQFFYRAQNFQECIHSESYSNIINVLYSGSEKARLFRAAEELPVVKRMMAWAGKWTGSTYPMRARMVAFALFEGLLFHNLFLSIQKLKDRNVMPGVVQLNELISRDEYIHCAAACHILKNYVTDNGEEYTEAIIKEAVELCDDFQTEAAAAAVAAEEKAGPTPAGKFRSSRDVPAVGINIVQLKKHTRAIADSICEMMGRPPIYHMKSPFPEMVKFMLNGSEKTNFFEYDTTTQYNQNIVTTIAADECGRIEKESRQPRGLWAA